MKQQWTRRGLGAVCLLASVAAGCGDSGTAMGNDDVSAAGRTPGSAAAGTTSAAGAAGVAATAGASAGAAGGGVAGGGAAGGGAAGGGAAAPSGAGADFECGPASTMAPAELYAAAASALLPPMESSNLPCAFGSCHNSSKKVAGLELVFGGSLTDLVGKPSCQAPNLKLVEPGGGNAALAKSWLYLKLAAPVDGSAELIADPSWGMANNACGQTSGDFGVRMPFSAGSDGIGPEKLATIRAWICAGAPPAM